MPITKISRLTYDANRPYRLNKNTGEIHDLNNEQPNCKLFKIVSYQDYTSYTTAYLMNTSLNDGCKNCNPGKHTK